MAGKKKVYTEAMSEIQEILNKIENDALDVDELSDKIKRVSKLLKICKDKLHKTEKEVDDILKDIDNE